MGNGGKWTKEKCGGKKRPLDQPGMTGENMRGDAGGGGVPDNHVTQRLPSGGKMVRESRYAGGIHPHKHLGGKEEWRAEPGKRRAEPGEGGLHKAT